MKEEKAMIPGFGVAGQVMCPLSFMAPKICNKEGCEWWCELTYVDRKVARCAVYWLAILSTELRESIDKLKENKSIEKPK